VEVCEEAGHRAVKRPAYRPYLPQCEAQQLDDDLWIVDGPEVGYRFAGLTLPCPTRMTIVRIGEALWLHSPICLSPALVARLADLGEVAWIVAPNSFHYTHVADWAAHYPEAECHLSRDLAARFAGTLPSARRLDAASAPAWNTDIDQYQVDLGTFTETVFFHRSSAALIVTDLLQNFEADRIHNLALRFILWAGGSIGPDGKTSIDIRLPAWRHRARLREALKQMLQWKPRRIMLAHGKCYDSDIQGELHRAFRWAS
jgi:hypothetical protein